MCDNEIIEEQLEDSLLDGDPDKESWRNLSWSARSKLLNEISKEVHHKQLKGVQKYGMRFKGDPLLEAYDEALDMCIYLKVAILQRNWERDQIVQSAVQKGSSIPKEEEFDIKEQYAQLYDPYYEINYR